MVLNAPLVHSNAKQAGDSVDSDRNKEVANDNYSNNNDDLSESSPMRNSPVDSSLGSDGKTQHSSDSDISLTDNTTNQHSSSSPVAKDNNRGLRPTPELSSSSSSSDEQDEEEEDDDECWAVHTLERDMPDYDYSHLVKEVRERLLVEHEKYPGLFSQVDIDKCCKDDWNVARYLLRQKMNVDDAFQMIRRSLRFKNESLGNFIKPTDFPAEFYMVGGTFGYEPDRKGNRMLYIRVKFSRKIPEIVAAVQGFMMHNLNVLDTEVGGKGISVLFDCQGSGLANADIDMLLFIITTLRDYFPKGLSYILVHDLPWILKPIWHLAKTFIPEEYKQLIKFSDANTITKYIRHENIPDFLGGTCKRSYTTPPEGCARLEEAAKLWGIDKHVVLKVVRKFSDALPAETVKRVERNFGDNDNNTPDENNKTDGTDNNLQQDYSID